jgi:hypothetical protein
MKLEVKESSENLRSRQLLPTPEHDTSVMIWQWYMDGRQLQTLVLPWQTVACNKVGASVKERNSRSGH